MIALRILIARFKLRGEKRRLEQWNNLASIAGTLNYAAWVVTDSSSSDEARERLHAEEMKIREKQKEFERS